MSIHRRDARDQSEVPHAGNDHLPRLHTLNANLPRLPGTDGMHPAEISGLVRSHIHDPYTGTSAQGQVRVTLALSWVPTMTVAGSFYTSPDRLLLGDRVREGRQPRGDQRASRSRVRGAGAGAGADDPRALTITVAWRLVLKVRPDVRDMLMSGEPGTFYITDHYRGYPEYVLACMATVRRDIVAELMETEWRRVAPKRAVAAFDQALGAGSKATRRRRSGAR